MGRAAAGTGPGCGACGRGSGTAARSSGGAEWVGPECPAPAPPPSLPPWPSRSRGRRPTGRHCGSCTTSGRLPAKRPEGRPCARSRGTREPPGPSRSAERRRRAGASAGFREPLTASGSPALRGSPRARARWRERRRDGGACRPPAARPAAAAVGRPGRPALRARRPGAAQGGGGKGCVRGGEGAAC